MKDIYRTSVLDKLSNPEQLDKALKITSPLSWLALIAIALVIVATGIWSVKGTIPVTVTASGIVAPANVGTSSIYSSVTGTDVLLVKNAGEFVKEGDVVATALESRSAERREIKADQTGVVSDDVLVKNGASVEQGSEIMRLSPMIRELATSEHGDGAVATHECGRMPLFTPGSKAHAPRGMRRLRFMSIGERAGEPSAEPPCRPRGACAHAVV